MLSKLLFYFLNVGHNLHAFFICIVRTDGFLPYCIKQTQGGLLRRKLTLSLSFKCMDCDKTEERSVQIFIPYERDHLT